MVSMSTPAARMTFNASAVTSGPIPSPPMIAIRCAIGRHREPPETGRVGRQTAPRSTRPSGAGCPLAMAIHQFSRAAYERMQAEFDDLSTRGRFAVAEKIERAREMGDLKENGDYHAAKDEQGHMEGRIRQSEYLLENGEIIEPAPPARSARRSRSCTRATTRRTPRPTSSATSRRSRGLDIVSPGRRSAWRCSVRRSAAGSLTRRPTAS